VVDLASGLYWQCSEISMHFTSFSIPCMMHQERFSIPNNLISELDFAPNILQVYLPVGDKLKRKLKF
jgi:hypothetical protein